MGPTCRNIELYLLAAAGNGPLHSAQIGNEGTILHTRDFLQLLIDFIRIGHLGDCLWTHKRPDFNDAEACFSHPIEETIAKAHFADADLFR